jgi:signal transduction histidine kinase
MSTSRLLGVIALAGTTHLVCSWALLQLLGKGSLGAWAAVTGIIVVTSAVAMLTVARSAGTDLATRMLATRMVPAAFAVLPPIASFGLGLPWIGSAPLIDTLPVLAATTAPGIAIALTLESTLWAVAARVREVEALARRAAGSPGLRPTSARLEPPSLAGRLTRLVAGLGLATVLLVLAGRSPGPQPWLALAGVAATMITAVLAAASAGLSPGRDVQALASRLDAIGWDEADSTSHASAVLRPLAEPVRVTSFDAVGELFRNLERLRARLADDVGTYKRALDRTHAADAAKREFLSAVSHELRAPLDSILDLAQRLLSSDLNPSQLEDVRLIIAGGEQLRELIEDILDLSMIESGEIELRFAACDLAELVEQLVDIHRAQLRGPEVELLAAREGTVPLVSCDRKRVGQVLTNLLSNAIKFTEQGRVVASIRHEPGPGGGQVQIAVTDTGVGIASDELGAIFEEYRQVGPRKRKVRIKGTGLGLAIARRIARAHGGSLAAQSQLGVGSTLTLRLPVEPIEPIEPIATSAQP